MSAAFLEWRGLPYDPDRFFIKGTELAAALVPDTNSRFAAFEVRGGRDDDGFSTLVYHLRDAETVTDCQVANGARSKTVAVFDCPLKATAHALQINEFRSGAAVTFRDV